MRLVLTVIVALMLGTSSAARAEDKAAARQAYLEGSKYYDLNQYAEALESFKRAYWNYEEPSFLYNIAQCHRALKHKSEAIEFYRSYLRKAPSAPNRDEVQKIIADLESALAQERAVATAPPQGTIAAEPAHPAPPSAATTTTTPAATTPPPATRPLVAASAGNATAAATTTRSEKPARKRTWVWIAVAGAAVVVAGVAIGVGIAASPKDPTPSFGSVKVN